MHRTLCFINNKATTISFTLSLSQRSLIYSKINIVHKDFITRIIYGALIKVKHEVHIVYRFPDSDESARVSG